MKTRELDVVVIGAGPAGEVLAGRLSEKGDKEVAIIESHLVGGECSFYACMPSKALLRPQELLNEAARVPGAREAVNGDGVDVDAVLRRRGDQQAIAGDALARLEIEPGQAIEVDERLRVPGLAWLYAVGDVNGRSPLTHAGKYQARLAADTILGEEVEARADGATVPRVVFTDPQVAAAGHTLAAAEEAGIAARAIDLPTSGTAGASFYGRNAKGTTRFVVDAEREVLVGATFVDPEVGELVHAATIAIAGEVPLKTLVHAIPSFPTRSELWLKFLEAYGL